MTEQQRQEFESLYSKTFPRLSLSRDGDYYRDDRATTAFIMWQKAQAGIVKQYPEKLPCNVQLLNKNGGGVVIEKDCSINTLHRALSNRAEYEKTGDV